MHGPMTVICDFKIPKFKKGRYGKEYFYFGALWHIDPCKDGSDDSCGWFMRSRHGNKTMFERIVKAFDFNWDRIFVSEDKITYYCGLFMPSGSPNLSVTAITLNLFWTACFEYFKHNRNKANKFMKRNLYDILMFAENPIDSLYDSITMKFGNEKNREERIKSMANCIYGWILREQQKWWQHPRWHFWHWEIQIYIIQKIHRWLFRRCCKCNKRLKFNESALGSWNANNIWHQKCNDSIKTLGENKNDKRPSKNR